MFKRVNQTNTKNVFEAIYNNNFYYKIGKEVVVENADESHKSCACGIHLSTQKYWNRGDTLIQCRVNIADIITCQEGKVRCRKCTPIRIIEEKKPDKET